MANTPNRNYPKVVDTNELAEDVTKLQQLAELLDIDVASLFAAVAARALLDHTHPMAAIEGLVTALAGKAALNHVHSFDDLTDVAGMAAATIGQIPYKSPAGWTAGDPASVLGNHSHTIEQITGLQTALDGKAPTTHSHTISQITGLQTALDGKASTSSLGTASTRNIATGAEFAAGTANRAVGVTEVWDSASAKPATWTSSLILDFSKINHWFVMGGNTTLGIPTNLKAGQTGYISIYQGSTGGQTMSFAACWRFANGVVPALSTANNAWDKLYYQVEDTTAGSVRIHANLVKGIA